VAQLLDPPTKMLNPRTIAKIVRGGRGDAAPVRGPHIGAGVAATQESARPA
jgi:hypothetical protein